MAIHEYEGKWPKSAGGAFVPESPDIIGDAAVGVWAVFGKAAVVRPDVPGERIDVKVPAWVVGEVSEMQKQEWPFYREFYAQLFASRYLRDLKRIG